MGLSHADLRLRREVVRLLAFNLDAHRFTPDLIRHSAKLFTARRRAFYSDLRTLEQQTGEGKTPSGQLAERIGLELAWKRKRLEILFHLRFDSPLTDVFTG
jgi:hypothetical protein